MRFLTADWKNLVLINYVVDPAILLPKLPLGTELDYWNGQAYVSLVGFMFENTRVLGVPIPFHRTFEEVNLRFYVRRWDGKEYRRGVVFIKEIVPRFAIAAVARGLYRENYVSLPMRHKIDNSASPPKSVEYSWQFRHRWNRLHLKTNSEWKELAPGSDAEFITEHYYGYTAHSGGHSTEYRVEHVPWKICSATETVVDCDIAALYGREFEATMSKEPASSLLAQGSPIAVYWGSRVSSSD